MTPIFERTFLEDDFFAPPRLADDFFDDDFLADDFFVDDRFADDRFADGLFDADDFFADVALREGALRDDVDRFALLRFRRAPPVPRAATSTLPRSTSFEKRLRPPGW